MSTLLLCKFVLVSGYKTSKMRNSIIFSLSLIALLFSSCGADDPYLLEYDGTNNDAPLLQAGTYLGAARFTADSFADHAGETLESIDFYLKDVPTSAEVVIFSGGTESVPGSEIYSANVTLSVRGNSWNSHTLSQEITLGSDNLWLGLRFTQDGDAQVLGCDVGPANENGDKFQNFSGDWETLRSFSAGTVDINWNIKGVVVQ